MFPITSLRANREALDDSPLNFARVVVRKPIIRLAFAAFIEQ